MIKFNLTVIAILFVCIHHDRVACSFPCFEQKQMSFEGNLIDTRDVEKYSVCFTTLCSAASQSQIEKKMRWKKKKNIQSWKSERKTRHKHAVVETRQMKYIPHVHLLNGKENMSDKSIQTHRTLLKPVNAIAGGVCFNDYFFLLCLQFCV